MGKKRHRRSSNPDGFWRREYGGAPMWFLVATVVVIAVIGVISVNAMLSQPTVQARPQQPVPTFDYSRTPEAGRPTALFIGDSYTWGAAASSPSLRWSTLVSQQLGWTESNHAIGGTGYLASPESCSEDSGCPPFPDVIASLAGQDAPDLIIVSGGRNDPSDPTAFRDAVTRTVAAAQSTFPGVLVYLAEPLWDDDALPNSMTEKAAIVEEVATATGATYLATGQPLVGHPDLLSADSIHPSDAGHAAISQAFLSVFPR